jgi:hypothetical protein
LRRGKTLNEEKINKKKIKEKTKNKKSHIPESKPNEVEEEFADDEGEKK